MVVQKAARCLCCVTTVVPLLSAFCCPETAWPLTANMCYIVAPVLSFILILWSTVTAVSGLVCLSDLS